MNLKSDLHLLLCISGCPCVTIHRGSKFTTAVWKPESTSSGGSGYLNHFLSWFQSCEQDLHLPVLSAKLSWWMFSSVTSFVSGSWLCKQELQRGSAKNALVDIPYFAYWPRFASLSRSGFCFPVWLCLDWEAFSNLEVLPVDLALFDFQEQADTEGLSTALTCSATVSLKRQHSTSQLTVVK